MAQVTFEAAYQILDALDGNLSGDVLKKQFKGILKKLEVGYGPAENPQKSDKRDEIETIVEYLNEKAGTHYRMTTRKTQTLIAALLKDGYGLSDFRHVIDVKCAEWLGTSLQKHLAPDVLFNAAKFEKYVNQRAINPKAAPVGSKTPEWFEPNYKNETTAEEQAELEKFRQEMLAKMG